MIAVTALVFLAIGLALAASGVWLIALGGDYYYAIAGIAFMVTALLLWRRKGAALHFTSIWSDHRDWTRRAEELLDLVRLADRRHVAASSLPHGDQRKLEVAILMALEPRVYMFDEPTAGMSVDEVPVILDLIRTLKAQKEKTILLVEHKMDVVRELSDRIIVLHNGQLVADGDPAEVIASPVVQQAYLGTAPVTEEV